jgi:hypothetical protein
MDGLSAEAERLFTRLIMRADDYGRFHSDHRLVKANCFPLADDIKAADIGPWLSELSDRGLIVLYEVDGRKTLAIANYGQRLRTSRAKFPPFPGMGGDWLPEFSDLPPLADNCPRLPATSRNAPPEEKPKGIRREAEDETETETETETPKPPKGDVASESVDRVLPLNWKKLSQAERRQTRVGRNSPTMCRIGRLVGRGEKTLWTVAETAALMAIGPQDHEIRLLEMFYRADIDKDDDRRRTSLATILNNWSTEMDKSRIYLQENGLEIPEEK